MKKNVIVIIISVVVVTLVAIALVLVFNKKTTNKSVTKPKGASEDAFVQTCVTYCDGGKYVFKEGKGYCVCPDGYEIVIYEPEEEIENKDDVTKSTEVTKDPKVNKTDSRQETNPVDPIMICTMREEDPDRGKMHEEIRLKYDKDTRVIKEAIGTMELTIYDEQMLNDFKATARENLCPDLDESDCDININGNVIKATLNRTKQIGEGRTVDEQKTEIEGYKGSLGGSWTCN